MDEGKTAASQQVVKGDFHPDEGPCPVCRSIAEKVLRGPSDSSRLQLGTWGGFLKRTECKCCQMVVEHFRYESGRDMGERYDKLELSCCLKFYEYEHKFWITDDSESCSHHNHWNPLVLLAPVALRQLGPRFITLDIAEIDIQRLRLWPQHCDQNHHGTCHSLPKERVISPARSLTLIDVQQTCIVQPSEAVKYVALSYVWGEIPDILEATTENFCDLCVPGSLTEKWSTLRLPRTILDAMSLARIMYIQYLWVDRLCIIQNNQSHLNEQLHNMASIYANSYFTIIAADGQDADYGLRGIGAGSTPRCRRQMLFQFSDEVAMIQPPHVESPSSANTWHTRAWTFQERSVSQRAMVFVDDSVYWQCRSATYLEEVEEALESEPRISAYREGAGSSWPAFALQVQPYPDLYQYYSLVKGYNQRNLSSETDALNAFSAIITAMNPSFPGGFFYGIPEFLFDYGLLWSLDRVFKRRTCFPSWSWLGWSGETNLNMCYELFLHPILPDHVVEVFPVVHWYKSDKEGRPHTRINNDYFRYQALRHEAKAKLPDGWVRRSAEGDDNVTFFHQSFPKQKFLFPLPTSFIPAEIDIGNRSPYLYIRTKSCLLQLGSPVYRRDSYARDLSLCLTINMKDQSGQWAGILESLFMAEHEYTQGCKCEVIAISRAVAKNIPSHFVPNGVHKDLKKVKEISHFERYEFYNVLWIEWKSGIAYRKAIGRIWKDAWERQELKEVDVKLG